MAFVSGGGLPALSGKKWTTLTSTRRRPALRRQVIAVKRLSKVSLSMGVEDYLAAIDEAPSDVAVPEAPPPPLPPASTPGGAGGDDGADQGRQDMVRRLIEISAVTNRGQLASSEQRAQVDDLITTLESRNPVAAPVDSAQIDGVWTLIYSATPFYKTNPLLLASATPFVEVGQVRQTVSVETGELINEVDVIGFPGITATVTTTGRLTPVGPERFEVTVENARVKGGRAFERFDLGSLNFDVPVEDIYQRVRGSLPETFIDTYYLDDILRISRSKNNSVFVFAKMT